ncbi:hypothetical protein RSOLAG1IB_10299 [Rhizoctonia solani AG-1 IB]|uniref:Uncharacterized protein n=1 Tax=Thanatephorus cucumeris (strain AG1-IB / isolate 7/3/14) TaxID=1108050 RepID=A0A0B7FWZ3_THACB|nr:hypothetical protein RSOLAG1IB_10299 [Rhizoctonia solani AG-1 IB]
MLYDRQGMKRCPRLCGAIQPDNFIGNLRPCACGPQLLVSQIRLATKKPVISGARQFIGYKSPNCGSNSGFCTHSWPSKFFQAQELISIFVQTNGI